MRPTDYFLEPPCMFYVYIAASSSYQLSLIF